MVNAFRMTHHIPEDREIYLMFDGEKLDPSTLVEATELDDLDYIEVYVR
jgi:hypothetical protein